MVGRAGATVRRTRDLDLAEDCTQDAFVQALKTWPDGAPANPVGWLTTVARRIAIDRLRRESTLRRKLPLLGLDTSEDAAGPAHDRPNDPLRLIFTCCHPALSRDARVALTLRLMCGLTTPEIASGLLTSEATVAARITRAKKKIAAARIPFRVPVDAELPGRLDAVLTVVHLVFTAGHTAPGPELTRVDLTGRAIELARMLVRVVPAEPEARGLLALLLLSAARQDARVSPDGELVLLADQDRTRWNRALTNEGVALATSALRSGADRFTLQAAIAGLHAVASSWEATDWVQVVRMYDALLLRWPSPVVQLNRAAARSWVPGADLDSTLLELAELAEHPALRRYAYLPAARADVLRRLGRTSAAMAAYDEASALSTNDYERRFLIHRRRILADPDRGVRIRERQ